MHYQAGAPPATVPACREIIEQADHPVIGYPLRHGGMPSALKGFLGQPLGPG